MRIRVSDPGLMRDLLDYLRRKDCVAIQTSRDIAAVSFSQAFPYDAARLELDLHLGDWLLRNQGATAVVID